MDLSGEPQTKARARALFSRVAHADRLSAGRLQPPVGLLPGPVRSVAELHMLLTPESRGMPAVDPDTLVAWIRSVIGDEDLAAALADIFATSDCYAEGCRASHRLLGERLHEAQHLLGEEGGVL